MNKEQIQQKFEKILEKLGHNFWSDGTLSTSFITKRDLLELLETGFNLGLEVAADYADAEYNILDYYENPRGSNVECYVECYVLKESILKFKI